MEPTRFHHAIIVMKKEPDEEIFTKSKELMSRYVNISSDHRTFHLGQIANASLRIVSENDIASGEKETIRKSRDLTVIMTVNGMAGSTQEATENVNDLDVVVLLEDSPEVLPLRFLCEEWSNSYQW